MGLGGALSSGMTGIRLHQNLLDIIGNNLSNVNTYGYKSSRLLFADLLSQNMTNGKAGNPMQVGRGVSVGSISSDFSQGTLETTGKPFDFAIQGDGFFVVNGGSKDFFTRVGAFATDANNNLIDSTTGYKVMDTQGNSIIIPYSSTVLGKATSEVSLTGNLSASASSKTAEVLIMSSAFTDKTTSKAATTATSINNLTSTSTSYVSGDTMLITGTKSDGTTISTTFTYGTDGTTVGDLINKMNSSSAFGGSSGDATASINSTGKIILKSNTSGSDKLSLTLADGGSNTGKTLWTNYTFAGSTYTTSTDIFDTQGVRHTVNLRFTKQGDNTWDLTASMNSADGTISKNKITGITFNSDGTFSTSGDATLTFSFNGLSSAQSVIVFNLGSSGKEDGLTQSGGASTAAVSSQDGYPYGTFDSVSVGKDGSIKALYTNGITKDVATMKIALFNNLNGLAKAGDNLYTQTSASGGAVYATAGSGRAGAISSGFLEGSNVDMATELTALITAQRGFQLNTKVITTADEVLAEAVNLKR